MGSSAAGRSRECADGIGRLAIAVGATPDNTTPAASTGGKADFVSSQKPDPCLASKFKDTDVGSDDQKIGDLT